MLECSSKHKTKRLQTSPCCVCCSVISSTEDPCSTRLYQVCLVYTECVYDATEYDINQAPFSCQRRSIIHYLSDLPTLNFVWLYNSCWNRPQSCKCLYNQYSVIHLFFDHPHLTHEFNELDCED